MSGLVLVAEDDDLLQAFILAGLKQEGLIGCAAGDGKTALDLARSRTFDLYLLDRNMPVLDGIAVLKALRSDGDVTPALFLTALGDVAERVQGLDAGADDYLTKPFAIAELMARVRALARRPRRLTPDRLRAGAVELDLAGRRVFVAGVEIEVTAQDVVLLSVFLRHPERAFTREALLDLINPGDDITPAAVEHAVSRLRRKLTQAGASEIIQTVRGVGYRLSSATG